MYLIEDGYKDKTYNDCPSKFVKVIYSAELESGNISKVDTFHEKCKSDNDEVNATSTVGTSQIRSQKLPYFMIFISLLEITFYFSKNECINSWLIYSPFYRNELWRFLTYFLLHKSVSHIVINVLLGLIIGSVIEFEQGVARAALVFLGGVVAGSAWSSVLQQEMYLLGASSGVYALLLSHLPNVILNINKMSYPQCRNRMLCVFVLVIGDAAFTLAGGLAAPAQRSHAGWAAHAGGAVGGLALGFLVFEGVQDSRSRISQLFSAVFILLNFVTLILINVYLIENINNENYKNIWSPNKCGNSFVMQIYNVIVSIGNHFDKMLKKM